VSVGAVSLALLIASVLLLVLDWKALDSLGTAQVPLFIGAPITGILGVLIAARRPQNPIGWLLLAIAATEAVFLFTNFLAIRGLLSGAAPDGWVAWSGNVFATTSSVAQFAIFFLIFFYPNGRLLPGPRWRFVAGLALAAIAVATLTLLVGLGSNQLSPRLPSVPNPLAAPALDGLTNGNAVLPQLSFTLLVILVLAAVIVRLRRSREVERHQMRWFAYVAAATLAVVLVSYVFSSRDNPFGLVLQNTALGIGFGILIPATIGLAVIKCGLYDLDIFVRRALVYGSLAVFITGIYVGMAVGIGELVGSGGKPNLALSILATAIVALGFQPVRERVQKVANRLVYGKRATPYEVLSEFSARVAESYAGDEVLARMAQVLLEGTGAEAATVWLRNGQELRPAATHPKTAAGYEPQVMADGVLPELPGVTQAVGVRHQNEILGALTIVKRRGESLTPLEQKLLDDLAHQAGLVLKNVGLTADLQARLEELRLSRQRLVSAQDQERRKLERNLHDGAQQHRVALEVKLGLVEMLLSRDIEKVKTTLAQLKGDADEALETLRDLARGIYPPLLADKGLVAALESQARKATVPVTVEAKGVGRYSQEVEATVYFCCLEALQNVQKYAEATQATVRLHEHDGALRFEMADDGRGFDTDTATKGAGLTNMTDRVDALGGEVEVTSAPGRGTQLHGSLPVVAVGMPA
jgi:signal transduction histidine kinase